MQAGSRKRREAARATTTRPKASANGIQVNSWLPGMQWRQRSHTVQCQALNDVDTTAVAGQGGLARLVATRCAESGRMRHAKISKSQLWMSSRSY